MAIYNKAGEGAVNQLSIDTNDVLIDKYTNNPIYQFAPKYLLNNDLSKVSTGIGILLNKNGEFNFQIVNRSDVALDEYSMQSDSFFEGIKVDILNKNKTKVRDNFASGDLTLLPFSEEKNIEIFGSFTKDYGIRMSIDDQTNISDHVSEYYVYGNSLYTKNITVYAGDGVYFNNDPIGPFQVYTPYVIDRASYKVGGEDNFYYIPKAIYTLNNKNLQLNLKIVFAYDLKEGFTMDWGDGSQTQAFYYNGNTFVGPGVTRTNTNTQDENFSELEDEINGKTYEFTINRTYNITNPSGFTINPLIKESSASQYTGENSFNILMASPISKAGIKISNDVASGEMNFEMNFLNNQNYTEFEKINIYADIIENHPITDDYLIKSEQAIPNEDGTFTFSLGEDDLDYFKEYFFTIVPYSSLGSGYAWKIGPYYLSTDDGAIEDTRTESEVGTLIIKGTTSFTTTEVEEYFINATPFIIDYLPLENGLLCSEYTVGAINKNKDICSTKLIVTNQSENVNSDDDYHLSQYALSDNQFIDYFINREIVEDEDSIALYAYNNGSLGTDPASVSTFLSIEKKALVYDTGFLDTTLFQ